MGMTGIVLLFTHSGVLLTVLGVPARAPAQMQYDEHHFCIC